MSYEYQGEEKLAVVCVNCGCRKGSHLGGAYHSDFYQRSFPKDYCPGNEGRMDWDKGPGTIFKAAEAEA